MLKLKKLTVKNFRSYGSTPTVIDFSDGKNLIGVIAENAAGKSSLFSTAIHFAIFGDNPLGKKQDLINEINKKNLYTEIELFDDTKGVSYKICRSLKPDKNEIYINGKLEDTGITKKDFDSYIVDLLKIDKTFFNKFINNNIINGMDFLSAPKGEKQKVLNYVFDLDKIEKMRAFIKEHQKTLKEQEKALSLTVSSDAQNLENVSRTVSLLEEQLSSGIKTINTQKEDFEKEKTARETNKNAKRKELKGFIDIAKPLKKSAKLYDATLVASLDKEVSDLKSSFSVAKSTIESKKKDIETLTLEDAKTIEKVDKLNKTIIDSKAKVIESIAQAKIKRSKFKTAFVELDKKAYPALDSLKVSLNDMDKKRASVSGLLTAKRNELKTVKEKYEKLKLQDTAQEKKKIDSECFKSCVYRDYSNTIKEFTLDKQLEDLEKEVTKLMQEEAQADSSYSVAESYFKEIDKQIAEVDVLKKEKNTEIELVKSLYGKYKQNKKELRLTQALSNSAKIEKLQREIQIAQEDMQIIQVKGKEKKALLDLSKTQEKAYTEYSLAIKDVSNAIKEYKALKIPLTEPNLTEQMANLEALKKTIEKEQLRKKEYELSHSTKTTELTKLNKEIKYDEFLLTSVVDNSQIVKYIIDCNLKVIEALVNKFLVRFKFPHKLKLEFTNDLELNFSNGRDFDSLSEGEKLRVKMSFAFSFIFFLKELNKNNLDLLVLDEIISSAADDEMIAEVFVILRELTKSQLVIIISHDDRIKNKLDKTFILSKSLFSKVEELK